MTEYETYEDYWRAVQSVAVEQYDETKEYADEEGFEVDELPSVAAEYAADSGSLPDCHPRTIIYHAQEGFYGEGYSRFVEYQEFEDNDPKRMLYALGRAAFFNDVKSVIDRLVEEREALGECMKMIRDDTPIYGDGVTFEYEYEKGLSDPEFLTYTFEKIDNRGNEWKVRDPDGKSFEIISPDVAVENSSKTVPTFAFKLFLDNICAKREHEREQSDE